MLVLAAVAACGRSAAPPDSVTAPGRHAPVPTTDLPWPATGALFTGPPEQLGAHYCTAAVLDTPTGNVLITAAHCVAAGDGVPARSGMTFIPGYHDHVQPFGAWTVTRAVVDAQWQRAADPDDDIAFLTVARAGAAPIEQVTGGYPLVLDPGPTNGVDAIGYPDDDDAPPGARAPPPDGRRPSSNWTPTVSTTAPAAAPGCAAPRTVSPDAAPRASSGSPAATTRAV
jgi:hypothetical protein